MLTKDVSKMTATERLNYAEMRLDEVRRNGTEKEREYWRGFRDAAARAVECERLADLCGLTFAQLGRVISRSYVEGYGDAKDGRKPFVPSEPLTIDELREMRGRPIWLEATACDGTPLPVYDIVTKVTEYSMETLRGENLPLSTMGTTWRVYYCKPAKEGTT